MDTFARPQLLAYSPELKRRFQSGPGMREWYERYAGALFDEEDRRLAESQAGHHFYEWLGAVVMHEATGYHCLLQKYQFPTHRRKRGVLHRVAPATLLDLFETQAERGFTTMQGPDLLMYAPDGGDFFFCEVKGPTDRLRPRQAEFFGALAEVTGRKVELLRFRELDGSAG